MPDHVPLGAHVLEAVLADDELLHLCVLVRVKGGVPGLHLDIAQADPGGTAQRLRLLAHRVRVDWRSRGGSRFAAPCL